MTQKCVILKGLCLLTLLSSCAINSCVDFKPTVCYFPNDRFIHSLPSAFPPISEEELSEEWGKEIHIGLQFAYELDYYRAITSFKRALFLLPSCHERQTQVEFCIVQSYYLAGKYAEALQTYEDSHLSQITMQFPALDELLLMLYDCYVNTCQMNQAIRILNLMDIKDPEKSQGMKLSYDVRRGNLDALVIEKDRNPQLFCFVDQYCAAKKSPKKARCLNAVLPGAGYLYVDQPKTAFTAFVINALFTAAAYQFFDEGYWAAGLVTAGIEAGWYFGGINGAGLAANEYNERVYEGYAKEWMLKQKLFPVLMFRYAF
ncbi:MAG: tetratricopeptide repeat protein [Parachlamydiaceae bacterium]